MQTATDTSAMAVMDTQPQRLNRRQRAKIATRTKVVDSARRLFDNGGYEAATIRTIAKGAGMSTGAVFANFDSKADLYIEIRGHNPVTTEQGRDLYLLLKDLLPEIEAETSIRRLQGHDADAAALANQLARGASIIDAIEKVDSE